MGLNIGAEKVYRQMLDNPELPKEIRTRASVNLSQIIRGSGHNTGLAMKGVNNQLTEQASSSCMSAEQRRDRVHNLEEAHKLCMQIEI